MATFADLFKTCYLTGGSGVEFAEVRLHYRGVDQVCRAFGATALTVGPDIFFREDAFAPHTPEGLRILAHEVAHVVQQHRGPVAAPDVAGGLAVAPAGSAEEHEADAAADALLSGRPFAFTVAHCRHENPRVRHLPAVLRAVTGRRSPAEQVTRPIRRGCGIHVV